LDFTELINLLAWVSLKTW